tara:strand:- start:2306 stop:2416 length:111 start_codon:yes stop_codon:yes gene_type:complete
MKLLTNSNEDIFEPSDEELKQIENELKDFDIDEFEI